MPSRQLEPAFEGHTSANPEEFRSVPEATGGQPLAGDQHPDWSAMVARDTHLLSLPGGKYDSMILVREVLMLFQRSGTFSTGSLMTISVAGLV